MAHTRFYACLVLFGLCTAMLICILACSKDSPNGPRAVEPEYAYFYDYGNDPGYRRVDLYSGEVDSFVLPYEPHTVGRLVLSYDNSLLLVPRFGELVIASTVDLEVLRVLPLDSWAGIAITRDNRYIAGCGLTTTIYDLVGDSTVYSDTIPTARAYFSFDGSVLVCRTYYSSPSELNDLYLVDMDDFTVKIKKFGGGNTVFAQPALNGGDIYLYIQTAYLESRFAVYRTSLDSLVYAYSLSPGFGEFQQTPDGSYVLISNSGNGIQSPNGPGSVYLYDVSAGHVNDTISTYPLKIDSTEMRLDVQGLFIGRYSNRLFIKPAGPDVRFGVLELPSGEPLILKEIPETTVGWPCRYGSL